MLREHDKNREPISIHALREEGDVPGQHTGNSRTEFLSTPSARRATAASCCTPSTVQFLSTPSARRATNRPRHHRRRGPISIHALREEGDFLTPAPMPRRPNFYPRPPRGGRHYLTNMSMAYFQFLSTPSARRATSKSRPSIKPETFLSTPSARRATRYPGGDGSRLGDFYPRPPRGGRPRLRTRASLSWYFYPRPPRGGRHGGGTG